MLRSLTPASDAQTDFAAFVSAQQAADTLLATIRQQADTKDASGLQDLKQVPSAGQQVGGGGDGEAGRRHMRALSRRRGAR